MLAFVDADNVSANGQTPGQHLLTQSRRISTDGYPIGNSPARVHHNLCARRKVSRYRRRSWQFVKGNFVCLVSSHYVAFKTDRQRLTKSPRRKFSPRPILFPDLEVGLTSINSVERTQSDRQVRSLTSPHFVMRAVTSFFGAPLLSRNFFDFGFLLSRFRW